MITIFHKIQKVETLQKTIDQRISFFKKKVGLDCVKHCSECCFYEDIYATPLEFLPMAYHACKLGLLDTFFDLAQSSTSKHCIFHRSEKDSWGCRIYPVRGLICRTFGFSAIRDKNGQPKLVACKVIKRTNPCEINRANQILQRKSMIPIMDIWYKRLAGIDHILGNEFLPLNEAIKKALEIIYFNFVYARTA
ncbi:MAG: hypothetical protein Kow0029_25720 [Candidatus Rifleibacteriota bacterium]